MHTLKGIPCPNCQVELAIGVGYSFDTDHSLICNKCEKPIFATSVEKENLMPKSYSNDRKSKALTAPIKSAIDYPANSYGDWAD